MNIAKWNRPTLHSCIYYNNMRFEQFINIYLFIHSFRNEQRSDCINNSCRGATRNLNLSTNCESADLARKFVLVSLSYYQLSAVIPSYDMLSITINFHRSLLTNVSNTNYCNVYFMFLSSILAATHINLRELELETMQTLIKDEIYHNSACTADCNREKTIFVTHPETQIVVAYTRPYSAHMNVTSESVSNLLRAAFGG